MKSVFLVVAFTAVLVTHIFSLTFLYPLDLTTIVLHCLLRLQVSMFII